MRGRFLTVYEGSVIIKQLTDWRRTISAGAIILGILNPAIMGNAELTKEAALKKEEYQFTEEEEAEYQARKAEEEALEKQAGDFGVALACIAGVIAFIYNYIHRTSFVGAILNTFSLWYWAIPIVGGGMIFYYAAVKIARRQD